MKKQKPEPIRLIRHVRKTVANFVWNHPALWGQSKADVFAKAFEAVWESCARTPSQANKAIFAALNKCRDVSKHNRSRLEPYHVRKAERKAADSNLIRDVEAVRQAAFMWFLEDYASDSQRTAIREFDRIRVRVTLAALSPADREIAHRYMRLGSIKAVALSFNVAPRTYLRREWADFRKRFIAAWNALDEIKLAQTVSSNPYVLAGR